MTDFFLNNYQYNEDISKDVFHPYKSILYIYRRNKTGTYTLEVYKVFRNKGEVCLINSRVRERELKVHSPVHTGFI